METININMNPELILYNGSVTIEGKSYDFALTQNTSEKRVALSYDPFNLSPKSEDRVRLRPIIIAKWIELHRQQNGGSYRKRMNKAIAENIIPASAYGIGIEQAVEACEKISDDFLFAFTEWKDTIFMTDYDEDKYVAKTNKYYRKYSIQELVVEYRKFIDGGGTYTIEYCRQFGIGIWCKTQKEFNKVIKLCKGTFSKEDFKKNFANKTIYILDKQNGKGDACQDKDNGYPAIVSAELFIEHNDLPVALPQPE